MADVLKLRLGSDVVCEDGHAGALRRFVLEPKGLTVTHLDVSHRFHHGGRLVPVSDIDAVDDAVHLACTLAQFEELAPDIVPANPERADLDEQLVFDEKALIQMPLFSGMGRFWAMGGFGAPGYGTPGALGTGSRIEESEALPDGEVDLEKGAHIFATDGHVGRADGLILDRRDFRLTHLLLGKGHVFGRREVAIPVASVVEVDHDGARLSLSKADVELLPSFEGDLS